MSNVRIISDDEKENWMKLPQPVLALLLHLLLQLLLFFVIIMIINNNVSHMELCSFERDAAEQFHDESGGIL